MPIPLEKATLVIQRLGPLREWLAVEKEREAKRREREERRREREEREKREEELRLERKARGEGTQRRMYTRYRPQKNVPGKDACSRTN